MSVNSDGESLKEEEVEISSSSLENESSQMSEDALKVRNVTMGTLVSIGSLFMFVGGALVTLMLLARAFELHGNVLVTFVVVSCAVVLGMAGYLITKIMGDKPMIGAIVGALFGGISAFMFYLQTRTYSWWL